jgi:hypothetical protein
MSNWKYTDASSRFVARTNENGSCESCRVEAISEWIAEGNTPIPADLPDPKIAIKAQIADLEAQLTPRRIREAMASGDYTIVKGIENQIIVLRSALQNLSPVL